MVGERENCKKDLRLFGRVPQSKERIAEPTIREFKHVGELQKEGGQMTDFIIAIDSNYLRWFREDYES